MSRKALELLEQFLKEFEVSQSRNLQLDKEIIV